MYSNVGKPALNDHFVSNTNLCYIQNRVIMDCVIKRLMCSTRGRNLGLVP